MSNDVMVRIGDRGPHVMEIQKALKKAGFWDHPTFTEYYGDVTDRNVRKFEKANNLPVDGRVDESVADLLGIDIEPVKDPERRWDGVTIQGSVFPDAPISNRVSVRLNKEMVDEYLPALHEAMGDAPRGFRLLCTVMAYKEGFRKGTRSYNTNNPGNIGNTDSGANKSNTSLVNGVLLQKKYIQQIVDGNHTAYPMNKRKLIKPYYSPEIAKHQKLYGMSPYVPGYDFVFTGQIDQFVKIYSTGARGGNGYLSMIISFFMDNGIVLTPESKLQDIIKIN
jgi:peptidoglycan hydrolase-like protein with peptidoglycan-binding domain